MRTDYTITNTSVGSGFQTSQYQALCKYDAIEQFLAYTKKYQGNCYSIDSIVSVDRTEDSATEDRDGR
jgi:hypothetical protein